MNWLAGLLMPSAQPDHRRSTTTASAYNSPSSTGSDLSDSSRPDEALFRLLLSKLLPTFGAVIDAHAQSLRLQIAPLNRLIEKAEQTDRIQTVAPHNEMALGLVRANDALGLLRQAVNFLLNVTEEPLDCTVWQSDWAESWTGGGCTEGLFQGLLFVTAPCKSDPLKTCSSHSNSQPTSGNTRDDVNDLLA